MAAHHPGNSITGGGVVLDSVPPYSIVMKGIYHNMPGNDFYDLICIGNYTKDTIISPNGVKYVDGGAMNYAAHAASRLGLKVAVVTRLAKEDQRVVDRFNSQHIDCFVTYTPASTCMKLEYPTLNPDLRTLSVASTAGSIHAQDLASLYAKAAVIGSSLCGEVGLDVIQHLKEKNVFLGVDMQGFVRVLRAQKLEYEPWDDMAATLSYVDVLKSDAVEAEHLTGEADIFRAAQIFSLMGPKEVVLTHKDGVLLLSDGEFYQAGFYPNNLNGRSGRGDTCIGSYMAMRKSLNPPAALIWAAAVTSLKMEKLGPFDRSIEDVTALIQAKYNHHPSQA
ncbi:MAG TPA: PfkB family carbohydrate kinase [Anaerolineales bacterium]